MINYEKVRLMTKLAIYENEAGKEDNDVAQYFQMDYLRHQVLKTIIAVTVGFILLAALVLTYQSEFLLDNALDLNYPLIGKWALAAYLLLLTFFIAVTLIGYRIHYVHSHARLARYYKMLGKVRKIEEREELQKDIEDEWGD